MGIKNKENFKINNTVNFINIGFLSRDKNSGVGVSTTKASSEASKPSAGSENQRTQENSPQTSRQEQAAHPLFPKKDSLPLVENTEEPKFAQNLLHSREAEENPMIKIANITKMIMLAISDMKADVVARKRIETKACDKTVEEMYACAEEEMKFMDAKGMALSFIGKLDPQYIKQVLTVIPVVKNFNSVISICEKAIPALATTSATNLVPMARQEIETQNLKRGSEKTKQESEISLQTNIMQEYGSLQATVLQAFEGQVRAYGEIMNQQKR